MYYVRYVCIACGSVLVYWNSCGRSKPKSDIGAVQEELQTVVTGSVSDHTRLCCRRLAVARCLPYFPSWAPAVTAKMATEIALVRMECRPSD